ncbi:MAG: hypothetical protein JNN16_09975 [Nitrospira sp.]|nr:hypothetical protein [Nitrospira sp.]
MTKTDAEGRPHLTLAIPDHGSRACLRLRGLQNKLSLTLLHNEAVWVSQLFRFWLWLLGIRQQRIQPS